MPRSYTGSSSGSLHRGFNTELSFASPLWSLYRYPVSLRISKNQKIFTTAEITFTAFDVLLNLRKRWWIFWAFGVGEKHIAIARSNGSKFLILVHRRCTCTTDWELKSVFTLNIPSTEQEGEGSKYLKSNLGGLHRRLSLKREIRYNDYI